MKKMMRVAVLLLAVLMLLTACGSQQAPEEAPTGENSANTEFVPQLDTEASVSIEAAVFFGNFEALDQVINHFNEYYPNVTITYEQIGDSNPEFLSANPSVDIFMTSPAKGYAEDYCVDLAEAGVDTSAVADGMLAAETVDGKLLALPMGLTLKGIVVNKTLLANEGLEVPETWSDFLDVLAALKEKGYTPLQGPSNVLGLLCYNMGMDLLSSDPALYAAVCSGDAEGAAALKEVYERVLALQEYISPEVNAEYPDDNYDGAILKFFEGDVPFWVCDTEKVSGMKKRETKSEAFSANPFEYEFKYVPMGDNGVYEYIEPWYGFAVNTNSDAKDYAVEFLRFMARQDELNTLASVKGVPSVARETTDERYAALNNVEKVEMKVASDGTVPAYIGTLLKNSVNDLLSGSFADADATVAAFASACAESVQGG